MKKKGFFILIFCGVCLGCGVKGDPQPPILPKEVGRGRPTYKRAAKKLAIEKPQTESEDEDEQEEDN